MAKKPAMTEAQRRAGAIGAAESFTYDPWKLRIVAARQPGDPSLLGENDMIDPADPACDHTFDWNVDERHVKNIYVHGCRRVIEIRWNGETRINTVVDGRHTVLAARIAAKGRENAGEPPIRVVGKRERLDDATTAMHAVMGNFHYERDPVLLAQQAQHLQSITNMSTAELAEFYGVTTQTIRNWFRRLEAPSTATESTQPRERAPRIWRKSLERLHAELTKRADAPRDVVVFISALLKPASIPEDAPAYLRHCIEAIRSVSADEAKTQ